MHDFPGDYMDITIVSDLVLFLRFQIHLAHNVSIIVLPIRSMTNLGSRAITWTSALFLICNELLPNGVLGSMAGGFFGESNLKKLFVTV